ncbi:hypothetical protein FB45DRAFT_1021533 [Roridomyces roridus]|uniref:Uncharacterized protein n=1 Tax=Roridomyces roridus TaxID=1738132 RepID=A0AAD7FV67_9AGAR|nr:hypothetical protein FB45DRAFT_1021533 [Roridomyces roridus]
MSSGSSSMLPLGFFLGLVDVVRWMALAWYDARKIALQRCGALVFTAIRDGALFAERLFDHSTLADG